MDAEDSRSRGQQQQEFTTTLMMSWALEYWRKGEEPDRKEGRRKREVRECEKGVGRTIFSW